MTLLGLRSAESCDFDVVSLGEVMLRLDPGESRIRTARSFTAWEGGGEYNVARGARTCFGLRAGLVSALADNEVGRLVESLIMAGGVDSSQVQWVPYDGVGRSVRVGLNFTERGHGVRAPLGMSDRGNSAAAQMAPGDVDWDELFGNRGVRWFHTGGVFAGLSDSTAALVAEALESARRHGTVTSFDLNFRPSLWLQRGGANAARALNIELARHIDVLFGADGHFEGLASDSGSEQPSGEDFEEVLERVGERLPGVRVLAATRRVFRTATENDWWATGWSRNGRQSSTSKVFERMSVLDRVGGGDAFAAGVAAALLEELPFADALNVGVAHGALVMTTPGDTSMVTSDEVLELARAGHATMRR